MGDFYTAAAFPPTYRDALFLADYANNKIYFATFDPISALPGLYQPQHEGEFHLTSMQEFATGIPGTVELSLGFDGALYQLDIVSGTLNRIRYTGYTPPTAVASASPTYTRTTPGIITFSAAGSSSGASSRP